MAQVPEDLWHVAIGPGDTKLLTLDQLDDLFRLEIIDANTKVWQPGMPNWLPLSVVAGLEGDSEDEEETLCRPALSAGPPPPPMRRRTAATAPTIAASNLPAAPIAPSPIRAVPDQRAAAPRSLPPPPAAPPPAPRGPGRTAPIQAVPIHAVPGNGYHAPAAGYPVAAGHPVGPHGTQAMRPAVFPQAAPYPPAVQHAATLSAWPPAVHSGAPSARPAPVHANATIRPGVTAAMPAIVPAAVHAPESLRPLAVSVRPMALPEQPSSLGTWVVMLAVCAGLGVSLYRNDVLRSLAASAGQEKSYLALESHVGAPGFGTPRAVEALPKPFLEEARAGASGGGSSLRDRSSTTSSDAQRNQGETKRSPDEFTSAKLATAPATSETQVKSANDSDHGSTKEAVAARPAAVTPPAPSPRVSEPRVDAAPKVRATARISAPAPEPAPKKKEKATDSPAPSLGIRGSTNQFDPLNGKL